MNNKKNNKTVRTSWKSAIIEGTVVVLCPVEVLSRRQTQHQHKHMAHSERTAGQHGTPEPAAQSVSRSASVPHCCLNKDEKRSAQKHAGGNMLYLSVRMHACKPIY